MDPNNNRKKSQVWYLENLLSKSKCYLFLGETKIGRHAHSIDIKLDGRFVSKLHCVISLINGCVEITDMVSYFFSNS